MGYGAGFRAAGATRMTDRRRFLALSAAALAALATAPAHAAAAKGPRFRDRLAIDGAGGLGVYWFDEGDPRAKDDLAALRASGLDAIVLTVAPSGRFWLDDAAREKTGQAIARCKAMVARHADHLLLVQEGADLERARRGGRTGIVMTFQGTESLGEDVDRIAFFRELGVRVIQLTHNRRNLVGDGATEPGNAGLSRFGHAVVERLNAERVVVDLAHGSQRTMAEGIRASKAPVLISHTGCRALADLPRNTGDAELRALADRGGVAGIILWPYLRTDTQPMAVDVIRHLEHAIDVCGEDHVGIGTDAGVAPIDRSGDFEKENRAMIAGMVADGIFEKGRPPDLYTFIPDLNRADRFDVIADLLAQRGHGEARIAKILGGNMARVMREVWG